ncbi:family 2 encapsulin nanocompartment cargo protein terpene cyclase [Streptomyces solicathayae]|uniref:Terpene synthase n=1 Tax=Streptomyces solicathayae TaxID=3081768 RepID=A0ABZ0LPV4_9ACTN|nr:family 2 encapsulin nanocompartment cargo protein terpene cyclase [Streptomyces sp. HUAS YS2]WOX21382.1 family 2 encapsulin nanocompartment cargo protein terpene cyclase [Streptomyces sp. HUAS YS2]
MDTFRLPAPPGLRLPTPSAGEPPPAPPRPSAMPEGEALAALERALAGPSGFGTSAARLFLPRETPGAPDRGAPHGSGRVPRLYCPPPARIDDALGREVDDRLVEWAEQVGIYEGRLDDVRSLSLGRMIMLAFAQVDDPDRLLAAAKCTLAQWATDDYYCDDETAGAVPMDVATNLSLATAAVDPAHLPSAYAPALEERMRDDPVLVSLRSSTAHLARYANFEQITKYRHELSVLFSGYTAEAQWRVSGRTPQVWEFLMVRQDNSFMPCMVMLDAVGGYELPVAVYASPRVRRVQTMAASASVIVNDLYSMDREDRGSAVNFNLPALIEAEECCSREEAVARTVAAHDELMHQVEEESAALCATGFAPLQRYLADVWAWLGGNHEWHRTSDRYNG